MVIFSLTKIELKSVHKEKIHKIILILALSLTFLQATLSLFEREEKERVRGGGAGGRIGDEVRERRNGNKKQLSLKKENQLKLLATHINKFALRKPFKG